MIDMRLRLPELMAERGLKTAYQLSKISEGRISQMKAYRLVESEGTPARIELATLAALCDTLDVVPGDLFSRDDEPGYTPPVKPASRKRKRG